MSDREFGIVKVYDIAKGYGFIRREKGKDVFIFFDNLEGDDLELTEGTVVSFKVENTGKGPRALECRVESNLPTKS